MNWQDDADFCLIMPMVLKVEGGYVNHPDDPGGATNYGIAYNYNKAILKRFMIDKPEEMKYLKRDQAVQIYYEKYWLASGCPSVRFKKLKLVHFDAAVNHGVGGAMWFMGRCGENFDNYIRLRELSYKGDSVIPSWLRSSKLGWQKFGKGWMNRLARIRKDAENL